MNFAIMFEMIKLASNSKDLIKVVPLVITLINTIISLITAEKKEDVNEITKDVKLIVKQAVDLVNCFYDIPDNIDQLIEDNLPKIILNLMPKPIITVE